MFLTINKKGRASQRMNTIYIIINYSCRDHPYIYSCSHHPLDQLWIKDAPKLNIDTDKDVCTFIDQYVKCNIPDDEDRAQLVSKVQKHRHSATCRSCPRGMQSGPRTVGGPIRFE